jgi:hypothetical protein
MPLLLANAGASEENLLGRHYGGVQVRGHFSLAVDAYTDRPPQRSGVDQDRNDSLSQADQTKREKLSVVENSIKWLDSGRPKGEKQDLNTCDCTHQDGFDRKVNAFMIAVGGFLEAGRKGIGHSFRCHSRY